MVSLIIKNWGGKQKIMKTIEQIDQQINELKEKLNVVKGTETEVYTRIVGYHRAVDNWNNGKKEEYFDRREFRVNLHKVEDIINTSAEKNEKINNEVSIDKDINTGKIVFYKMFTSQYCRNCPPVKEFMSKLSIVGEEVDVSTDLGINASRSYDIMSTPTVILFDDNDNIISKAYSVEDLKKVFIKEEALVG